MLAENSSSDKQIQCKLCKKIIKNKYQLRKHISEYHTIKLDFDYKDDVDEAFFQLFINNTEEIQKLLKY